jgi:hypothetical protein
VNMGCRLNNVGSAPLALNRLELTVSRGVELIYELGWHLFYSAAGLEHLKDPHEQRITIAEHSVWERGVQFRSTRADLSNVWPAGSYDFELLGWAGCRAGESRANVRTRFRATVDPRTASDMAHWRNATAQEWNHLRASDRALAFPLRILDPDHDPT